MILVELSLSREFFLVRLILFLIFVLWLPQNVYSHPCNAWTNKKMENPSHSFEVLQFNGKRKYKDRKLVLAANKYFIVIKGPKPRSKNSCIATVYYKNDSSVYKAKVEVFVNRYSKLALREVVEIAARLSKVVRSSVSANFGEVECPQATLSDNLGKLLGWIGNIVKQTIFPSKDESSSKWESEVKKEPDVAKVEIPKRKPKDLDGFSPINFHNVMDSENGVGRFGARDFRLHCDVLEHINGLSDSREGKSTSSFASLLSGLSSSPTKQEFFSRSRNT
jgi:hypothetical protein